MLDLSIDPRQFIQAMGSFESQMPWAVMKALNEVGVTFQADERARIQSEFIVRRPWVLQGVKINRGDFATKSKLEVIVRIDPSRDFLGKFEFGGMRVPRAGRKALSVPIAAKRTPQTVIPTALRPKSFHFKGHGRVLKGDSGTFLIQRPDGSGVILQRKARSVSLKKRQHGPLMRGQRRDYRLVTLYVLKPRTRVPPDLHFHQTAQATFAKAFGPAMTKWWNEAVRTANTGRPIAQGMALPAGWTE